MENKNRSVLVKADLIEEYKYFDKSLVNIGGENHMISSYLVQTYDELAEYYEAIKRVLMPKHEKSLSDDDLIEVFGTPIRADIVAEHEPKKLAEMLKDWDKKVALLKEIKVGDILEEMLTHTEVCITMIIDGRLFHGYEMKTGMPRVKNDMLKFSRTGKSIIVGYPEQKGDASNENSLSGH